MKEKTISKISLLINSILFFIAGFTIISYKAEYIYLFHLLTTLLLIIIGFISFVLNIIKTKKPKDIAMSITTLLTGIFFFNNEESFLALFPIGFGLYMFLNGIIKFITYIIFKKRENYNYYLVLLGSIVDFIFSYIMITNPKNKIDDLTIILGLYLLLFSVTYMKDFFKECLPPQKRKLKRSFRISMPIIFSALVPYNVLLKINKFLNSWSTPIKIDNKKVSGNIDLEIFIHVKDSTIGKFGHADLCYNGTVYSYGCYDEESKRLFESLGNGTLFTIKSKEKYLRFCTEHADKTIFCFGITLTKKQKEKVEEEIKKIKSYTYPWKNYNKMKNKKLVNPYATELVKETDAKFYKFNKSNYKTYFLLSTNCVKLVDEIVGKTGIDLLKINGVITPGSYYEYLNKEFKKENSIVLTKEIYTKEKR